MIAISQHALSSVNDHYQDLAVFSKLVKVPERI